MQAEEFALAESGVESAFVQGVQRTCARRGLTSRSETRAAFRSTADGTTESPDTGLALGATPASSAPVQEGTHSRLVSRASFFTPRPGFRWSRMAQEVESFDAAQNVSGRTVYEFLVS